MNRVRIELGAKFMIFVSRLTNSYASSVNRCSVAERYVFASLLILIVFSQTVVAALNGSLVVADRAHWGLL